MINRVSCVRDLGVTLDERLSFDSHLELVFGKAYSNLGLIFRRTSAFTDLRCLKALYCSLVRPVVDYASVVFCTNRAGWNNKLEGVQKRFTRCLYRRLFGNSTTTLPLYSDRCILFNLDTLESRRTKACVSFISNLLRGNVDAPDLLCQLSWYVPARCSDCSCCTCGLLLLLLLRNRTALAIPFRYTSFGTNDPSLLCLPQFNEHYRDFNF